MTTFKRTFREQKLAESRYRRTLDALADVDARRTVSQKEIEAWLARLGKPTRERRR